MSTGFTPFLLRSHTVTTSPQHLIPVSDMIAFWNDMEQDGLLPFVFYDGLTDNYSDYIHFMSDPAVACYYAYDAAGRAVASCWLNNYIGLAAQIHFVFLRHVGDSALDIARATVAHILRPGIISALYGITPKPYRHAWHFARQVGFKVMGEVPGVCWVARRKQYYPGVFTLLTKPDVVVPRWQF